MSQRLANIETRTIVRDSSIARRTLSPVRQNGHASPSRVNSFDTNRRRSSVERQAGPGRQFAFEDDLRSSRPYTRIIHKDGKWSANSSAIHSHNWSHLSGLSLADVSDISVLNLAVYKSDLWDSEPYVPRSRKPDVPPQPVPTSLSRPSPVKTSSSRAKLSAFLGRRSLAAERRPVFEEDPDQKILLLIGQS